MAAGDYYVNGLKVTADGALYVNASVAGLDDATDVTKGDALVAVKRQVVGSVASTVHDWIEGQVLNVKTDFGAVGDGVTDDTAAILAAFTAGSANNLGVYFPRGTYLTDPITIANGSVVPSFIDFGGSTIRATSGSSGPLVSVENPHTAQSDFYMANGILDANSACSIALKIHGSQRLQYKNLKLISATSHGFQLAGETGYGIYGNLFQSVRSESNGGAGIDQKSTGAAYYIATNTWDMCSSLNNSSYGMDCDYASGTYISLWCESNGAAGVNFDNNIAASFYGGHMESNNSPDASFKGTSNSRGVMAIGVMALGTVSGFTSSVTTGNIFFLNLSGAGSRVFSFDGSNLLVKGGGSFTTGITLDGIGVINNFIRFQNTSNGTLGLGTTGYLDLDQARSQIRARKSLALAAAAVSQATGEVGLGNATQTTVGAAGGASALPGAPSGYLKIYIGTTQYVIPYWAQA